MTGRDVLQLCDRISVLRDGRYVGTLDRAEATEDRVVQLMIGRRLNVRMTQNEATVQSEANFMLVDIRDLCHPQEQVCEALMSLGAIVRDGNAIGCPGWARVSVGTSARRRLSRSAARWAGSRWPARMASTMAVPVAPVMSAMT